MKPFLPGLPIDRATLLDERHRPDFRDVFGRLSAESTSIATAVTRVRLSTLDLTAPELSGVEDFRVLVAELSAVRLTSEARGLRADPRRGARLDLLSGLLEAGRLSVRSAPLAGWSPDFTVFFRPDEPMAVLTGFHWFERPYPNRGPALAGLHFGRGAELAAARHAELWEVAHDVGPAIWSILKKARGKRALAGPLPG